MTDRGGCEGHRAEVFALELARAHAALNDRKLSADDLKVGVKLAIIPRSVEEWAEGVVWEVLTGNILYRVICRSKFVQRPEDQMMEPPPPPPPPPQMVRPSPANDLTTGVSY
jgi:magnesium chelatase subunit D